MVNCVIEMDKDSLWVATNTRAINCLVKGKMKKLLLKDSMTPVINYLYRNEKENLYAASDHVLFIFHENNFTKLPFTNSGKRDINPFISYLIPVGDYLLVTRDFSLIPVEIQYTLFSVQH
jgi:hypothetical protein